MFIPNLSECGFVFSFPFPSTPQLTSATQLVLRAHKEAVNSLSGNGSAKLGTVATAVAAANSTAMEASKDIEAAMKISMRAALGLMANKPNEDHLDDLTIMKVHLVIIHLVLYGGYKPCIINFVTNLFYLVKKQNNEQYS